MSKAAATWKATAANVLTAAIDEIGGINSLPTFERRNAIEAAIMRLASWPSLPPRRRPTILRAAELVEKASFLLLQTVLNKAIRGRNKWATVSTAAALLADALEIVQATAAQ